MIARHSLSSLSYKQRKYCRHASNSRKEEQHTKLWDYVISGTDMPVPSLMNLEDLAFEVGIKLGTVAERANLACLIGSH